MVLGSQGFLIYIFNIVLNQKKVHYIKGTSKYHFQDDLSGVVGYK